MDILLRRSICVAAVHEQRRLSASCLSFTQGYLWAQTSSPSLVPRAPYFLALSWLCHILSNLSLFVHAHSNTLLYFLVYVEDLIITGSDPSLVDAIIKKLNSKFSTKDLGVLSYFSGVEVLATSTSLLLSQQKYVIDLLSKQNMLGSTPLAIGTSHTANDGTVSINATMYRHVVSGL